MTQPSEPIFNMPAVVVATLAVFCAIHALRVFLLTSEQDLDLLLLFAFIPARYEAALLLDADVPGGFGAQIWSFVTYALIHADLTHLLMNSFWLLPFGTAVARRFETTRYLLFFATTAAAGAAMHLAAHAGEVFPMIGASAAVSGMMGGAIRFAFHAPMAVWRQEVEHAHHMPALPLGTALRDPRILTFVGIWFALNLLFGIGAVPLLGQGQAVAWEAHIGGFLAGLLLFSLFDPVPRVKRIAPKGGEDIPRY